MKKTSRVIPRFLRKVADWASTREDILAVARMGSQARGKARGDSYIDLVRPA